MGYYIETNTLKGKAQVIASQHNGTIVSQTEAQSAMNEGKGVVVVVDNGPFEAAAFAFDQGEFEAFIGPADYRPKKFVVLDRTLAEKLSNYRKR